jgi:hypothetical protein
MTRVDQLKLMCNSQTKLSRYQYLLLIHLQVLIITASSIGVILILKSGNFKLFLQSPKESLACLKNTHYVRNIVKALLFPNHFNHLKKHK